MRQEFADETKSAAIKRQQGRCAFCGVKLRTTWTQGQVEGNAHHLIPDSFGGAATLDNCVYLCWGDHQLMGHGNAPFGIDKQGGTSRTRVFLKKSDFRYLNG